MSRTILVPVDGSTFAEHALPLALALARRAQAGLHLATVSVPVTPQQVEGMFISPAPLEEAALARNRAYLENLQARLRGRLPGPISGEVLAGPVGSTLCDLAATTRCDAIVMATHGRSPLGRFFLGGVTDHLIHHINRPLLLVHPGEAPPDLDKEPDLSRMVLPLDGSPLAEQIIEPALEIARLVPESTIVLVRAIPASGPDEAADVEDSQTFSDARDYLDAVAARLAGRGVRVQTHVVFEDHPDEAILHEAQERHAGLIAMETHGRGGLSRLLHGSVTDKVLRGAHVPVLIQRPNPS
jgi:nucleotide-binding universal stress UspA family protein